MSVLMQFILYTQLLEMIGIQIMAVSKYETLLFNIDKNKKMGVTKGILLSDVEIYIIEIMKSPILHGERLIGIYLYHLV
ncbi:hypothetical protein [Gracilibacillus saliphilus]|uniref:hypothetical protein n=1 Tax=Gracilibacillus saliphilus TaxID=543890 RepID=UPI0013D42370|nr:hypothetical protein [Gracilibacillus saliphilus]